MQLIPRAAVFIFSLIPLFGANCIIMMMIPCTSIAFYMMKPFEKTLNKASHYIQLIDLKPIQE